MSLEESIKALAESNVRLAESNEALAASQLEYAETIRTFGTQAVTSNTVNKAAPEKATKEEKQTPAQKKAAEKAAAAKAAKDDDGFDAPAPGKKAKKLTHDDVKAKLLEIRDAAGDKQPALDLIGEHGYSAIPDIQEKDFDAIHADAVKWLEENVE